MLFPILVTWADKCARYVLGHEAMKRMSTSNVLIVGLKGLGVEIGNTCCSRIKRGCLADCKL